MSWSLLGVEGLSFHCTKNVRIKSSTLAKTIKKNEQNKKKTEKIGQKTVTITMHIDVC